MISLLTLLLSILFAWESGLRNSIIVGGLSQVNLPLKHARAEEPENHISKTSQRKRPSYFVLMNHHMKKNKYFVSKTDHMNEKEVTSLKTGYRIDQQQYPILKSVYKKENLQDPEFRIDGHGRNQYPAIKAGLSKEKRYPIRNTIYFSHYDPKITTEHTDYTRKQIPQAPLFSTWSSQTRMSEDHNWFWVSNDGHSLYNMSLKPVSAEGKWRRERSTGGRGRRADEKLKIQNRRETKAQSWRGGDIGKQREVKAWNWRMRGVPGQIDRAWKRRKVVSKILSYLGPNERGARVPGQKEKTEVRQWRASGQGKWKISARQKKAESGVNRGRSGESSVTHTRNRVGARRKREESEPAGIHDWNEDNCDTLLLLVMDLVRSYSLSYITVYIDSTQYHKTLGMVTHS